jgi:type I restriction enzyme, S subunit
LSSKRFSLADVAAPIRNAIVGGPFGSNLVSKDYVATGVPVIRGQNMGGKWVSGEFAFVSAEKAGRLSQNLARPGDLVFTQRGTLGQVSIVPRGPYDEYVVSQSQMKITVDPTKADVSFLYYLFRTPAQLRYIFNSAIQTGVPHTNLGILKATPIDLPPLSIQKDIAAMVGALDDRIALLRETNATLEAIAQALFKSWFVDFDPVRTKQQGLSPAGMDEATAALFPDSFEESALGLVPKGWACIDLTVLTKRFGGSIQTGPFGSQLHASDYVESGVPVVMPKDIVNRRATTDSVARIGAADADRLSRHKLQAGDIVFSRRGDVERHALITEREVGWLCGTGCLLLRPGHLWESPGYLSMLLDAPRARTWLVQHAVGATMPNLNTGILGSVPVVLPSTSVLRAFEELMSVTEQQRSRNASMSETLATLRDTLLPRLISGQLRLPEALAEMEEAA